MDKVGVEVHFIRLVYFTIFDQSLAESNQYFGFGESWYWLALFIDTFHLLLIVLPLFVLSVKYYTASAVKPYTSGANALLAPIAVITLFFFQNYDILWMAIMVLTTNLWVSWKQMDSDEYSWASYYRDEFQKQMRQGKNYVARKESYYDSLHLDPITYGMNSLQAGLPLRWIVC